MKAERRHELQTNSLSKWIEHLPIAARVYADRILLAVVIILGVIFAVRWRMNSAEQRAFQAADELATAKLSVSQLARVSASAAPERIAAERSRIVDEVNQFLEAALSDGPASDASFQSQVLVTRGDLYWTLANLPAIRGAATQPALQMPKSSDDYLKQSADAYEQVLAKYPGQKIAAMSAKFSLAAIAENRHDWPQAEQFYNQVKSSDVQQMFKDLADDRLKMLPDLKQPLLIAPASQPATQPAEAIAPSTEPAAPWTTEATPFPTMVPSSQPASTQPASTLPTATPR